MFTAHRTFVRLAAILVGTLIGIAVLLVALVNAAEAPTQEYEFKGGFPTPETVRKAYDDADLTRAVEAYKFFYPTVSIVGTWKGNINAGVAPNKAVLVMRGSPAQIVFTPNSDTPYAGATIDLSAGPMVVELPPGPLMSVVNDLNQRYVMDLGLPGPDAGKGGKHLILPPGYKGEAPAGYYTGAATTNRVFLMFRVIPPAGDMSAAIALLKTIKIRPLNPPAGWADPAWLDQGDKFEDFTPVRWERGLDYWKELHELIDNEPAYEAYRMSYGQLAALGIEKGKPFAPDARMKAILEKAARTANDQMRVQSFADRRADRIAWPDRKWEWASLRPENGTFDLPSHKDLVAREKWFYQAQIESPAMFRRDAGAGSLYWLGTRDGTGAYLDGSNTYKLTVPLPVPAKLFWSITVYDPENRIELRTDQGKAALRSLFELKDAKGSNAELYFGPEAPAGQEARWIKTIPGKGWFTYFRIYGPEQAAFDRSWKPGDFEPIAGRGQSGTLKPPQTSSAALAQRTIERRAVEAAIWGMPAVNYDLMLQEMLTKTAGKVNQMIYWGRPLDWRNQTLTPNPDTLYFMAFLNTKDAGPIVIDVPPAGADGALNANIVNVWQQPLEDAGLLGVDKGKGIKLLMLPPGYSDKIPDGYVALQPRTFGSYGLFRSNLASHGDADVAKSVAYGKRVKIYPLSQASAPQPTVFTDIKDVLFDSTIRYDESFFEGLNRIVQSEPWLDPDRVMIDQLKSLGIEKGKPFAPTAETKQALGTGIREAQLSLAAKYDAGLTPYFDGTHWTFPAPPELIQAAAAGFAEPDNYPIDARGLAYSYAFIGIKRLGAGQFYLISIKDKDGENFDGAKTYRLTVPPNAPVEQYWSATAYDRQTHALIKNVDRASRASNSAEVRKNADGSVDLYFGPKAPEGKEPNWVPTDPARTFELMFRLYAPTKALFDKKWVLPDVEKLEPGGGSRALQ